MKMVEGNCCPRGGGRAAFDQLKVSGLASDNQLGRGARETSATTQQRNNDNDDAAAAAADYAAERTNCLRTMLDASGDGDAFMRSKQASTNMSIRLSEALQRVCLKPSTIASSSALFPTLARKGSGK